MSRQYWIKTTPAAWAGIDPGETATPWLSVYRQAISGYNRAPVGEVVYRILCSQADADAIFAALNAHTAGVTTMVNAWDYQSGAPDKVNFVQDATGIVSLMLPKVTYDESGNPISTEPTATNINEGVRYAGGDPLRLSYFGQEYGPEYG